MLTKGTIDVSGSRGEITEMPYFPHCDAIVSDARKVRLSANKSMQLFYFGILQRAPVLLVQGSAIRCSQRGQLDGWHYVEWGLIIVLDEQVRLGRNDQVQVKPLP